MTGVSRFIELAHPWRYSKAEGLEEADYRQFAYALVGPSKDLPGFTEVHTEYGFERMGQEEITDEDVPDMCQVCRLLLLLPRCLRRLLCPAFSTAMRRPVRNAHRR